LIVGVWMGLSTVMGASVAIRLVAGAEFEPAIPVLQIQGLALIAGFLAVTGAFALVSLHRHVALLVGNLAGLAVSIVATAILVPAMGAEGGAVATLAAESLIAVIYGAVLFGSRVVRYDFGLVPRIAGATILSAALLFAPLEGILLVVVGTVVYWGALFALRGVPPEVIDAMLWRPPRTTR
jgi:O-antigen/teichoic acid export membrane protein